MADSPRAVLCAPHAGVLGKYRASWYVTVEFRGYSSYQARLGDAAELHPLSSGPLSVVFKFSSALMCACAVAVPPPHTTPKACRSKGNDERRRHCTRSLSFSKVRRGVGRGGPH